MVVALLVASATSACSRSPDQNELAAIARAGRTLLAQQCRGVTPGASHHIPSPRWPDAIRALKPKDVRCEAFGGEDGNVDGLFIKTREFFVTEGGYFIPRPGKAMSLRNNADPSYEAIGNGVYSYSIEG
jgi:hypothetical protein